MRVVLKLLPWISLVVLLPFFLIGVGTVGVFAAARLGVASADEMIRTATASAAAPPVEHQEKPELPVVGVTYATQERIVNLADRGALRYLKAQVVLEFAAAGEHGKGNPDPETYKKLQEELRKELAGRAPFIEDQIATILSSKTSAELLTPEGKTRLKQEISEKLHDVDGKELLNVYLTQFIVQ